MCDCLSHNGFLTRKGHLLVTSLIGVDRGDEVCYLDKVGSVSGSESTGQDAPQWQDNLLNEQYLRFVGVHDG